MKKIKHNSLKSVKNVRHKTAFFLCLVILFGLIMTVIGQDIQTSKGLNIGQTVDSLSKTKANRYLIGSGDVLDIRVYNRPQLSREAVRVDERGMIRVPLIEQDIQAGCRTESELAQDIAKLYLEYLRNPHVEVFIKDFQSKPVAIIGAVHEPGRFQMQRKVRLLELISLAGGPTDLAGGRIQVKHDSSVTPCENETNGDEILAVSKITLPVDTQKRNVNWYQLKELLQNDVAEEDNPFLIPGDIVNLVEADKVYVVGNVYKPVVIPLKEKITLSQAIAMAGGTLPATNFDKVRIVRENPDSPIKTELVVDLKAINKQRAEDIILQANDIVDVPTSSGKKFVQGLINSVAPAVSRLPLRVIP